VPVKRRKLPPVETATSATDVPLMFPNQRLLRLVQVAHYLNRSVW